ncbi:MAG: 16S rRNA (cytosine(1402)-N(4))-methyltransferase RsmH [Deltaproteobacteria bacterium]|nr:16S rRNA (cytosine(1402)-N(4))-methyltransferase RsmH [Deltaproteobacteria bacterium]
MEFAHRPVMGREAIELLACKSGGVYVDGTLGGGGHARMILDAASPDGRLIGIDRDDDALKAAAGNLEAYGNRVTLVKENFRNIRRVLSGLGISGVDGIVLDLGVSSYQFESPERGFSFRFEARLDMRMDRARGETAYDLVNTRGEDELTGIFRDYGEEREARRIARAIVRARETKPIETTGDLVNLILFTIPKRFQAKGIHPATRVFQALRIAVNDELGSLGQGLAEGFEALNKNGRMAVISFHSLEDRIVKNAFRELSTGCVCPPRMPVCVCGRTPKAKLVTRKAIKPSDAEVNENPRARSAKLRAIEKF